MHHEEKPTPPELTAIRAALRQQLQSDHLFGVCSVPLTLRQRSAASISSARAPTASPARSAPDASVEAKEKGKRLRVLNESHVQGCIKCGLAQTRSQTVFGQGSPNARLVFVGEAPGFEEDRQGLAFIGRAGQLLTRMIGAMGLAREDVFICNVLKCRPPNNRDPSAEEILACSPHLREQLAIIEPEVLVALGAPAAKTLLNTAASIGKLRGRFHEYQIGAVDGGGVTVPVMPTYHPAYLLRNPAEKRKAWDDLQLVMKLLGLPPSQ